MAMSDQAEVIAFLMSPDSYPDGVEQVARIDTHCAIVFLAGNRAYKLKRAVKLPYLDFSTLERRRRFCERELEINRLTAPDLYLGVCPVVRDAAGGLGIGGEGEAVDWLLVMKRFDDDALLDHLATTHGLNAPLMERLARAIWRFHEKAPVVRDAHWLASLDRIIGDLGSTLCNPDTAATVLDFQPTLDAIGARLTADTALLGARQQAGFVRRCHGDLHLNNIVLIDGQPTLFDAIEFDEELATIDVLYDLAFLIMDLWHRDMPGQANAVLNAYFQREVQPGEWNGLALLPLFLALRAGIRAMVSMHKLLLRCGNDTERQAAIGGVHSYARLAGEVLEPQKPQLIVIGGLSGTGKTTLAQAIAAHIGTPPGAIHLRSDVERKLMYGVEMTHRLPPETYTPEARDAVYQRVLARAECVLRAGHPVVVDAVFLDAQSREEVRALAARTGAAFRAFWLEAETLQMMARVSHRRDDASDADPPVVVQQLITATRPDDWRRVSTRGDVQGAAEKVLAALRTA
jgi:aminoglycoside phosphotransferase family enzyme/predicted kinase